LQVSHLCQGIVFVGQVGKDLELSTIFARQIIAGAKILLREVYGLIAPYTDVFSG
jgi:hypothetical protein